MRKGWLPESLTRRVVIRPFAPLSRGWPASPRNGGRLQFGTVAGIKSEFRPTFKSEYLAGTSIRALGSQQKSSRKCCAPPNCPYRCGLKSRNTPEKKPLASMATARDISANSRCGWPPDGQRTPGGTRGSGSRAVISSTASMTSITSGASRRSTMSSRCGGSTASGSASSTHGSERGEFSPNGSQSGYSARVVRRDHRSMAYAVSGGQALGSGASKGQQSIDDRGSGPPSGLPLLAPIAGQSLRVGTN